MNPYLATPESESIVLKLIWGIYV